jgi:VWFA-related protein
MTVMRWASVLGLLFVLVGLGWSQGPRRDVGEDLPRVDPVEERRVVDVDDPFGLSIDVDLVNVDVVVTKDNNPIAGLERDHFKIFVDDKEQRITNFRPTDAPLTVVLVIEFGNTFTYYYDDVIGPAAGFIQSLRDDDWAAIISFDVEPKILTDFTQNENELFYGLSELRLPTFREMALYDAVDFTLERMENVDGKKVMFLLSSGFDTISRTTYGRVLDRAEASDTVIYAVGMGQLFRTIVENDLGAIDRIAFLQAENALRSLASATGGLAFFPRFRGEYGAIYQTIAANLRYQYSLGFVPTGLEPDDDLKEIKIEVTDIDVDGDGDPDELKARHRKGFYFNNE